ncbi:MAG: LuxE/PaaK family acyltransferase [Rhodoferax sp.]
MSAAGLPDHPVFGLGAADKARYLLAEMNRLTAHHQAACPPYQRLLAGLGMQAQASSLAEVPFLPVRLFKHHRLQSIADTEVIKTMTSSGTSGQAVSQIVLDKATSAAQVKALSRIMTDFIGPRRLPMLVVDCRATVADRLRFSARTAGVLGFSMFGREITYALTDAMEPDLAAIDDFVRRHGDAPVLVFGFTFVVWKYLVRALEQAGRTVSLGAGLLVHGGGWKQLANEAVGADEFRARVLAATGIARVHNYYGMVEQTGSIFMECEAGHLHAPVYSDILVRDPVDFSPLPLGQAGLIQLLSVLPHSYPGHSLLSEDIGEVLGEDDCACGRRGRYFRVHGRLQGAEVRGCSDTFSR